MGTLELRSNLHQIIDGIQNEQFLQTLCDFLQVKKSATEQESIWSTLNEEQRTEVMLAWEESGNEKNLVEPSRIFGKGE